VIRFDLLFTSDGIHWRKIVASIFICDERQTTNITNPIIQMVKGWLASEKHATATTVQNNPIDPKIIINPCGFVPTLVAKGMNAKKPNPRMIMEKPRNIRPPRLINYPLGSSSRFDPQVFAVPDDQGFLIRRVGDREGKNVVESRVALPLDTKAAFQDVRGSREPPHVSDGALR
jgi:hypothetical protein